MSPPWANETHADAKSSADDILLLLNKCDAIILHDNPDHYRDCIRRIEGILERLLAIESQLVDDLEIKHGKGKADSPGFRQFMAEYMVSFPAANLDFTRDTIAALKDLLFWLLSPACSLAYESIFILSGVAGSGKTHGVCDAGDHRFKENLLTCIAFGHEFGGEPDPWTRLLETLGLPITLGANGLLDALNAAGEASGSLIILCIDAINETRPLRYWRDRLIQVTQAVQRKPYLRLCITCRSSFLSYCLPDHHNLPVIEHTGFAGMERDACLAFFRHYGLEPPIAPILQPELSNPLYLRLLCETLCSRGIRRIPAGWHGLAPTIRAFLNEKERQFSVEYETSEGARIINGSLMAIVRAIVDAEQSAIPWSKALQVISVARPQAGNLPVLEWLVRADLLVEDAPTTDDPIGNDSVVRPSFERLGDFLVAMELLELCSQNGLDVACQTGGRLYHLFQDADAIKKNAGIIAALSILVAERKPQIELPSLVDNEAIKNALTRITIRSFPSRDPSSFTIASEQMIREALTWRNFAFDTMDSVLAVSWQPSAIDAFWVDVLLKQQPMAQRDAFWCGFLHDRFESHGTVSRLISAAFELPLGQLDHEIAERWSIALLWFTAAADRRVKDKATRAVVAVLAAKPEIVPLVLNRFLESNDDEVRERALLSSYGALVISADAAITRRITSDLHITYKANPSAFDNALIRDHIRCIAELASELGVLHAECDPELTMQPIHSRWPLDIPSEEDVKRLEALPKVAHSCLHDDFFIYAMGCLRPWDYAMSKQDMGKWILERIAREFGFEGSGCENYDRYMLGKYGGGRGKQTWAERIGKKYQWVALFQLASRLCDHIERKRDDYTPMMQRTPMILLEERKMDPTLPYPIKGSEREADAWWMGDSVNLQIGETLSDLDWVNLDGDLPTLENLLSVKLWDSQRWLLLVSYPAWDDRLDDDDWDQQYRQVWIHIESYLVKKTEFETGYRCLHRRNFFGQWMKQGASWLYGFAGEYPWATPFNLEPDDWHSTGGYGPKLPVPYIPAWNELTVEWQYDASLDKNIYMLLPTRAFFSPSDLWWNGKDGYRIKNGKSVFRDPSISEIGPRALITDIDDLLVRLENLDLRLIWTVIGEKWILGGRRNTPTPRRTFSQIARLEDNGAVSFGDRVFFDDYDKDTGPA